jgi:hypothetical protein
MQSDEGEGWERVGVAAALAKQYAEDEREFLSLLATFLEGALPGNIKIDRAGWFGKKTITRVAVTLDDFNYLLEDPGRGPLVARRARVVRGVALKTEQLSVPQWIEMLSDALDQRASTSQAAREALSRLLGEL